MGFVSVMGGCCCCGKLFGFHPNKVPSFKGEPICKDCIDRINEIRKKNGFDPIPVMKGAYETGQDEQEVDWSG